MVVFQIGVVLRSTFVSTLFATSGTRITTEIQLCVCLLLLVKHLRDIEFRPAYSNGFLLYSFLKTTLYSYSYKSSVSGSRIPYKYVHRSAATTCLIDNQPYVTMTAWDIKVPMLKKQNKNKQTKTKQYKNKIPCHILHLQPFRQRSAHCLIRLVAVL